MVWIIITLSVFCFILLLILGKQDEKDTSLSVKNRLLKDRLTALQDAGARPSDEIPQPEQHDKELTQELVCEAVRFNGYVPTPDDGFVMFMVGGEKYFIQTERIPYLLIDKSYAIQKADYDMVLFRRATSEVTSQIIMGKVIISDDGSSLRFNLDSFENSYEHLRDAFPTYIGIINETQQRFGKRYDELKAEQVKREQALLGPRTIETTAENKILS